MGHKPINSTVAYLSFIEDEIGAAILASRGDPSHGLGLAEYAVESGEQLVARLFIQEPGDWEAVAGLECLHRRLGLGGIDPHDRPRVVPERAQMLLRNLDVALR
jgi:hypothetical protein